MEVLSALRVYVSKNQKMLDYEMLYIRLMQENFNPTNQSVVTNFTWRQSPIPWGAKDYWGIDYTLTVEEIA